MGLDIHYGIDGERVMCEWTDSTGNVYKKRLYFSECEITETDGVREAVYYINAPDGLTAVMMHHGGTYKIYYICTDHLGSVTLLMNDAGNTVERHAYDAWGRKRNVYDWSDYNVENGKLDRGYTGHESLREFGLINMNGRMYDPILGRMLSPDNYVQDPFNLQNYNRYTYCLNNPLKYTDPSGEYFLIDDLIAAAIGGVINLASNIISGNINGSVGECIGKGLAAFGAGAIGGVGAMYPEFGGWLWGGAVVGATNAWLSGADGAGIVIGAGVGVFSSVIGGAAGSWASQHIGGFVINGFNITSPVLKGVVGGAVSGYVGGYLATGDPNEAWEYAMNGMWQGAVIGGISGGINGYRYAVKNNLDPWNKLEVSQYDKHILSKNGIYSTQKGLNEEAVSSYLEQMRNGTFNKTSRIFMYEHQGNYYITDGHCRMTAAYRYYLETGNDSYIFMLKGNAKIDHANPMDFGYKRTSLFK